MGCDSGPWLSVRFTQVSAFSRVRIDRSTIIVLITCIVYTCSVISVGVYKYDAKQLAAGEDKQQDAQPLLEERTLGGACQCE